MSVSTTLRRHILILKRLSKGPATVAQILDFIQARFEEDHELRNASRRTFHRDKADILQLYGQELIYNRSDKRYYLDESGDPDRSRRIIEAFDMRDLLKRSEDNKGHVFFEHRRPLGTEYFESLLCAIQNRLVVKYTYQNYSDPVITERTVHPHALKESKSRWYLLASEELGGKIKAFGLDRISGLEITKRTFRVPKDFNPNAQYQDCFGITAANSDAPEDITLSFEPVAGRYVKSFPLHHSQRVLVDNEREVRISLRVYLTREFIMEVLSYGASMRVIGPGRLREMIREELMRSLGERGVGQPALEVELAL
jgi:hypothetical protein